MADKTNGKVVETLEQATQAEKSPDTFYILIVSLIVLVVIGGFLLWWWGVFPSFGPEPPR
jgi:cytoskeletal protein RodZ